MVTMRWASIPFSGERERVVLLVVKPWPPVLSVKVLEDIEMAYRVNGIEIVLNY